MDHKHLVGDELLKGERETGREGERGSCSYLSANKVLAGKPTSLFDAFDDANARLHKGRWRDRRSLEDESRKVQSYAMLTSGWLSVVHYRAREHSNRAV